MREFLKTQGDAFEPETIEVMVLALDAAWASIEQAVPLDGSKEAKTILREKLARYIVELATDGQRDPNRMAKFAVHYFAHSGK